MSRPVILRRENGAEYAFVSAEAALQVFPDGTVVRFQDGAVYAPEGDGPEAVSEKLSRRELDAIATELGVIDAAGLPNKAAVLEAIDQAKVADGE